MSSYDVRIWKISTYKGITKTTYRVRWTVAGVRFGETFETRALAESFRAKLVTAQREGSAFDEKSGLPEAMARKLRTRSWYQHATEYVDMVWSRTSAHHRKGIAETLAAITPLLLSGDRGAPPPEAMRLALYRWAFNRLKRQSKAIPPDVEVTLAWVAAHTVDLAALADAALVRKLLDALSLKLDGTLAAASTVRRKRAVLSAVLRYAVELRYLDTHPFQYVSWALPDTDEQVDRQVVVNPEQARTLLAAVKAKRPEMEAFFGCMYYAALRPEEVLNLVADEYEKPAKPGEWGWLHLSGATLAVGSDWTDDGAAVERRQLKHRSKRTVRNVPVHPELAALLDQHVDRWGNGPDGRLFVTRLGPGGMYVSARAKPIPNNTYAKVWRDARADALTPAQARSPLARRPYDLRHACVSLWLNAGVPATQVAEWAGHTVNVLMRVYAKCIDGAEDAARRRIENALQPPTDDQEKPKEDPDS